MKNTNRKKAGMATLISKKVDLRTRNIVRDKEGYFIIIKELICQEDMKKNDQTERRNR